MFTFYYVSHCKPLRSRQICPANLTSPDIEVSHCIFSMSKCESKSWLQIYEFWNIWDPEISSGACFSSFTLWFFTWAMRDLSGICVASWYKLDPSPRGTEVPWVYVPLFLFPKLLPWPGLRLLFVHSHLKPLREMTYHIFGSCIKITPYCLSLRWRD